MVPYPPAGVSESGGSVHRGDATLRRSLDERMAGDQPPRIRLSQWTTVEFLPIAAAMDKLFEKAGWLTIR